MNITELARLPFSGNGAWSELRRLDLSIPFLTWVVVVPMSLLPTVLLYYAGTHYGDAQRRLIDDLLTPTTLYAGLVQQLLDAELAIHGMAHITGGGLPENLPRCLPVGHNAVINPDSWIRPEIFHWLQKAGDIPERDLWHTFNLGIGFCLVLPAGTEATALDLCRRHGHQAWLIGTVTTGKACADPTLSGLPA